MTFAKLQVRSGTCKGDAALWKDAEGAENMQSKPIKKIKPWETFSTHLIQAYELALKIHVPFSNAHDICSSLSLKSE